ncbi:MAG: aminotransferase class IV [Anaerohalosphaeraceae bacterium]|nr:aminotransferase class IV [Anaerohalosphaeraceae bacterium]
MERKVFFNNKIIDASDAKLSIADSGFLYGAGLFETMRSKNGAVFAIDDHLDRLIASATALDIMLAGNKEYLADAVKKTIAANGLAEARIRLTVSSGPIKVAQPEPSLLVTAEKYQSYPKEYYEKGVMVVLSVSRQNSLDVTAGHKATSCFSRIFTLGQAHRKGAVEALWFTLDGKLAEGCVSNVFIVKDSVVYTPTVNTPILPGVARKWVIALAAKEKIEVAEKDLAIKDLLEADEVFLTNVIMGVLPVIRVEAHDVGDAKPGTVTKKVAGLFSDAVESYCVNFSEGK